MPPINVFILIWPNQRCPRSLVIGNVSQMFWFRGGWVIVGICKSVQIIVQSLTNNPSSKNIKLFKKSLIQNADSRPTNYLLYLFTGGLQYWSMPSVHRPYGSATIFPIIPDPNTVNQQIPDPKYTLMTQYLLIFIQYSL